MRAPQSIALLVAWLMGLMVSSAMTLEVHNSAGAVHVAVHSGARLRVQGTGPAAKEKTEITRHPERVIVRCEPEDGEPIDLDVELPFGFLLEVTTDEGPIHVSGMIRDAQLRTNTGNIHLTAPWQATRIQLDSENPPDKVETPRGIRFRQKKIEITEERKIWRLRDRLQERAITYGRFRVKAESPGEIRFSNYVIPPDSPVKVPWQASAVLDEILRGAKAPPPPRRAPEELLPPPKENDTALFRSDVRMVNLIVTVYNARGLPVTDLTGGDFAVTEEGVPQDVTFAGSDSVPFNLAILLDMSGSTRPDRTAMITAAKRFVALAGPQDRVAVYALADDVFHVIVNLTDDHEQLLSTLERMPNVSGATPLYDAIVLAYAEELHELRGERNALIVISDGIDNQISRQEAPSEVKFKKLVKAASEMHALIYPVFLLSGERFGRGWSRKARKRMERLADASGGRLFPADSIRDLEPVFPQLASELRGVYSVAYYPKNQNFDGSWRNIRVEVKRPGVTVRSRSGYYAR